MKLFKLNCANRQGLTVTTLTRWLQEERTPCPISVFLEANPEAIAPTADVSPSGSVSPKKVDATVARVSEDHALLLTTETSACVASRDASRRSLADMPGVTMPQVDAASAATATAGPSCVPDSGTSSRPQADTCTGAVDSRGQAAGGCDIWSQFRVPKSTLEKTAGCIDIVTPGMHDANCFTKAYQKYVRGTGSVLATRNLHILEGFSDWGLREKVRRRSRYCVESLAWRLSQWHCDCQCQNCD